MQTNTQNTTNKTLTLDEFVKQLNASFLEEDACIDAIEKDEQDIAQDKYYMSHIFDMSLTQMEEITGDTHGEAIGKIQSDFDAFIKNDIQVKQADMQAQADKISQLDPQLKEIADSLVKVMTALANLGKAPTDSLKIQDKQDLEKLANQLISAMKDKFKMDLIDQKIQDGINSGMSDDELEALEKLEIKYSDATSADLNGIVSFITSLQSSFTDAMNQAQIDKAENDVWYKTFFSLITGANGKISNDNDIIDNSQKLLDLLQNILLSLVPSIASADCDFTEINIMMDRFMKRLKEILSDKTLSPKQKQAQILVLMMYALSFLTQFQNKLQQQKAKNQKTMSDAEQTATELNLKNNITNQKIQQIRSEQARINQKINIAAQIIIGATMIATSGGFAAALINASITTLSLLQATGTFDVSQAIANGLGKDKWVGDLVFGLTTFAAMMLAPAAESAYFAKIGTEASEKAAASAVEKAITNEVDAAKIEAIKDTAKQTTQKLVLNFYKQNITTILSTTTETLEKQAENAATNAIEKMLSEYGERDLAESISVASNEATAAELKIANKDVLDPTNILGTQYLLPRLMFAMANSNLSVDTMKDKPQWMQLISQIMTQLVCGMKSGLYASSSFKNPDNLIGKVLMTAQVVPQGLEATANTSNYFIITAKADAEMNLSKNKTKQDVLDDIREQSAQDSKNAFDSFMQRQQQQNSLLATLARDLFESDNHGVQALLA